MSGIGTIAIGYFIQPFDKVVAQMHEYHFLGMIFAYLIIIMMVICEIKPRKIEFIQEDVKAVEMAPWEHVKFVSAIIFAIIILIFALFADFSIFK